MNEKGFSLIESVVVIMLSTVIVMGIQVSIGNIISSTVVHDRDAWRLADYYAENRHFLKPWEPVRDESHCYPSGWQARLGMINVLSIPTVNVCERCRINLICG